MSTIDQLTTPLRNVTDTQVIAGRLRDVQAARFDVILPQSAVTYRAADDAFAIFPPEPIITDDGVFNGSEVTPFLPMAWRQLCSRLEFPIRYADRLRSSQQTPLNKLAAENIGVLAENDDRSAMYRFLQTDDGLVLRAIVSDRYGIIDNDVCLRAILRGLAAEQLQLGDCDVLGDVTPDRLRLRIAVPSIAIAVPELLGDYRSPYTGQSGSDLPILEAGIAIANSETGNGTYTVSPRARVRVCENGMERSVEFKRAHIGGRLDEGVVNWSDETRHNMLELITSQTADAVGQFVSTDYLVSLAAEMRAAKDATVNDVQSAMESTASALSLSDDEAASVFDCFARSGDMTVLGIGQAVTAAAQQVEESDRQTELEQSFWQIVEHPNRFAGTPA